MINVLLFGQINSPIKKKNSVEVTSRVDKLIHTKLRDFNPNQIKIDSIIYYDTLANDINYKKLYTYDQNKIIYTFQWYNFAKKIWINSKRVEYFFGEDVVEMPYECNLFLGKITVNDKPYYYEPCLGDTMVLGYKWDTLSKQWEQEYKVLHQINSDGLCEKSTAYSYDADSSKFVFNCFVFQEVAKGDVDTLTLTFNKNEGSGTILSNKYIYKYNDLDKLYLINDLQFQNFGFYTTDSLVYDVSGNITAEYNNICDTYYSRKWLHTYDKYNRIETTYNFTKDLENDPWEYFQTLKYYYSSDPITHTKQNDDETMTVYPNPVGDYLFIKDYKGKITITNLLGQVMKQQDIGFEGQIELVGMASGLYFITFSNGSTKRIYKQ
jgi:hypothetical protein